MSESFIINERVSFGSEFERLRFMIYEPHVLSLHIMMETCIKTNAVVSPAESKGVEEEEAVVP